MSMMSITQPSLLLPSCQMLGSYFHSEHIRERYATIIFVSLHVAQIPSIIRVVFSAGGAVTARWIWINREAPRTERKKYTWVNVREWERHARIFADMQEASNIVWVYVIQSSIKSWWTPWIDLWSRDEVGVCLRHRDRWKPASSPPPRYGARLAF